MSVAERGHNPGWLLLRVYDDHKPAAWSYVPLEEPLSVRPGVWFSVIRRVDRFEHRSEMRLKLDMAAAWIEHVPQPRATRMPSGVAASARMGRWRISGLSVKDAGCRGTALAPGARIQAIRLTGPAIARRKLGRRSSSRCSEHEGQRLRRYGLYGAARTFVHDGIQPAQLRGTPGIGAARPSQIRSSGPENRIRKPTLTVRPDTFINREQKRIRAKIPGSGGV